MFLSKGVADDVFQDVDNNRPSQRRTVENDAAAASANALRAKMQMQHDAFLKKKNVVGSSGMVMSTNIATETAQTQDKTEPEQEKRKSHSVGANVRGSANSEDCAAVAPYCGDEGGGDLESRRQTRLDDLKERGLATVFDPSPSVNSAYSAGLPNMDREQMRIFMMSPLPKGAMLECRITREKTGFSKFYPKFNFETETGVFIAASKKRTNNKTSNYLISLDPSDLNRQGPAYMGKVRANFLGSEFSGFGEGSNPSKTKSESGAACADEDIREEYVGVQYSSSLFGKKPRGPRKMYVVMPAVTAAGERIACKPTNPQTDGLIALSESRSQTSMSGLQPLVTTYVNKPPKWNDQIGAFVLNFNKRVTQASVKNFQLIRSDDPDSVYLQFGRVAKDTFNIDFRHPVSPFQAFSIALSSFDYKLCCE